MERRIIHLNIADFGAAVEQLEDSSLKSRPLILAPPTTRAVVYDMNEQAYQEGVRKGMRLLTARRLCRQAHYLPPRPERYTLALNTVFKTALHYTPLVEKSCGDGHLFLDVTGTHRLFGPPPDIGWRIRKAVRKDLGLDPIWSVAPNKLLAKVASRLVKPTGEYIVASGEEQPFLAPLPLSLLPGLQHSDIRRLKEFNLQKISHAAALPLDQLSVICGHKAQFIYQAVRGIDLSAVQPPTTDSTTINLQYHFDNDTNQDHTVRAALLELVKQAGHTLRRRKQSCSRITVQVQYSDGRQLTRQAITKTAVNDNMTLNMLANTALYRAWYRRVRLRKISLYCNKLIHTVRQLSLFTDINKKQQKNDNICKALDQIQKQFGTTGIQHGIQVQKKTEIKPQRGYSVKKNQDV